MRVLVCGGRDYNDWRYIDWVLQRMRSCGLTNIIHGDARGADTWAKEWAMAEHIPEIPFPAKWKRPNGTRDLQAGHKRNQQMIDEGHPDLILAFPGGSGTADMIRRGREHNIPVITL